MTESVLDQVLRVISSYTGTSVAAIDVDAKIGMDLGLNGGDSIEFLDELEITFGTDLSPLVDRHKIPNEIGPLRRLLKLGPTYSSDFTVRQLAEFLSTAIRR